MSLFRFCRSIRLSPNVAVRNYTLQSGVTELANAMKDAGVQRGYIMGDGNGSCSGSHPLFDPIVDLLQNDDRAYDDHEAIFFGVSPSTGKLMSTFIWKTKRGQGNGGLRMRDYSNIEQFVREGLRMSASTGRSHALAGIWSGGAKGFIPTVIPPDDPARAKVLTDYAQFLNSLKGCYIASKGAGMTTRDMEVVYKNSIFTTGASPTLGGVGNPSAATAMGVKNAMESALMAVDGSTLQGKKVAVQGLGNVGSKLVELLLDAGVKRVIGVDTNPERVADMESMYKVPRGHIRDAVRHVFRVEDPNGSLENSILAKEVDVLSPCAYGGIFNKRSVKVIKAKVICGASSSQLVDPTTDYGMRDMGITYVPGHICNHMGLVSTAQERYGSVGKVPFLEDPILTRHLGKDWEHSIHNLTETIIAMSRERGITTVAAAHQLSDQYADQVHPQWGHRTIDILNGLRHGDWAK